jgi:hypothetical protein
MAPPELATDLLYFNGLDGATGDYLVPPMTTETLARVALGEKWDQAHLDELRWRDQANQPDYALMEGLNPMDLSQAGWGIIFPATAPPALVDAIEEALSPLLELRKKQAGQFYKMFKGAHGHRTLDSIPESKDAFLARHGASPGPVDPQYVPYYLLIVADPQSIPYRFQYELDVSYAVGRIYFSTLDEYAQYAASVFAAEQPNTVLRPRRARFFGAANPGDNATNLSAQYLIQPLVAKLKHDQPSWDVDTIAPDQALKTRLLRLLGEDETPALLFTATHGVGFANGDQRQFPLQGGLVCQNWPRRGGRGELARDYYVAAEDIGLDARLLGLIAFFFACYGAGTPYWDDFAERTFKNRATVAPYAFLAALPLRLLSHPRGGALAIVGHVERAWTYSFKWAQDGDQTTAFESTLKRLVEGHPIGSALEYMNLRYSEISTMLSNELGEAKYQQRPDTFKLAKLWTGNNDARNYAIVGDPAVRLPVGEGQAPPAEKLAIVTAAHREEALPPLLVPAATPPATPSAPIIRPRERFAPAPSGDALAMALPGADMLHQMRASLTGVLSRLAESLSAFVNDVTSLEVATFVSDNVDQVAYDSKTGRFTAGAQQRALTRISFDGDTKVCVPVNAGQIDKPHWEIHLATVELAQAHRTAMLKIIVEVLTGIIGLTGGK